MSHKESNSLLLVLLGLAVALSSAGCVPPPPPDQSQLCIGGSGLTGESAKVTDDDGKNATNITGSKGSQFSAMATRPQVPGDQANGQQPNGGGAMRAANGSGFESQVIMVGYELAQIVDVHQASVIADIVLSGFSPGVAVSSDGRYAAASINMTTGNADAVEVIDFSTMTRTGSITLPGDCTPLGLAFIPGGTEFFVACRDLDSVRRYDLLGAADQSPLQEITGCNSPRDVTFTADGERGLFSCTETIQVYDVQSGTVAYEIPGFEDVRAFAANTAGTRAYVADRRADGGFLQVVNLETYDIINTVQVDQNPVDVFLSPDDDLVYVIGSRNWELSIHDAAGAILSTEPAPVYPFSGASVRVPAE